MMVVSNRTILAGAAIVALSIAGIAAQQKPTTPGRAGGPPSESAQIQQVRVALGHGQVAEARRLAEGLPKTAGQDLATALVDLFEGKDDAARAKLEPLARINAGGEASLELGLLEMRHGQGTFVTGRMSKSRMAAHRTRLIDELRQIARQATGLGLSADELHELLSEAANGVSNSQPAAAIEDTQP